EATEFFDGCLNNGLHVGSLRNVGFEEETVAASGADEIESFVAFGFAPPGENNFRAVLCEEDGGVAADAGGAASDESYFVFEILAHDFVLYGDCEYGTLAVIALKMHSLFDAGRAGKSTWKGSKGKGERNRVRDLRPNGFM